MSVADHLEHLVVEIEDSLGRLSDKKTADVRELRKAFSAQLKSASGRSILELADLLVEQSLLRNDFHLRFIACELVRFHADALSSLNEEIVERLARGMSRWEDVDTFCTLVAGQGWRRGKISDGFIAGWTASPDRWLRRSALVATIPLNNRTQGGTGDPERTLNVCRLLVDDRDDMVVKGMSWALRELAKRDPEPVRMFLDEMGERPAPRIRREVRAKLETGLKNPKG